MCQKYPDDPEQVLYLGCAGSHLDVSFVWPLVSVHTLHGGLIALQHVDTKERPSSHGILHTGVVRWQIHPADDEQPIHLNEKYFE